MSNVYRWVPAAAYAGLIFALSSVPADSMPAGRFWDFDKLIHAVEYAVLAALLWYPLRAAHRWPAGRAAITAWVIAVQYGITDELHQLLVPGRYGSAADVAADAAGAAIAVSVLWLTARKASTEGDR